MKQIFNKSFYKTLIKKRDMEFKNSNNVYGEVFIISTKTIRNFLFILENIIPFTFFMLSIIGQLYYKKVGYVEFLRIDKKLFKIKNEK